MRVAGGRETPPVRAGYASSVTISISVVPPIWNSDLSWISTGSVSFSPSTIVPFVDFEILEQDELIADFDRGVLARRFAVVDGEVGAGAADGDARLFDAIDGSRIGAGDDGQRQPPSAGKLRSLQRAGVVLRQRRLRGGLLRLGRARLRSCRGA